MEHKVSLLHAQTPTTRSYSEPDQSSPCLHILLLEDPFFYCPPINTFVFQVVSLAQVLLPKYRKYLSCPQ
jgi:hypothetical protein